MVFLQVLSFCSYAWIRCYSAGHHINLLAKAHFQYSQLVETVMM